MDTPMLPSSLAGVPPQQWIAAPSPVYLTGEEFLRLSSLCNLAGVTLTVSGRVLRPDNTIVRVLVQHAPLNTRTVASTDLAMPEGWLLGLTVRATAGAPSFGQVWVNLELGIGLGGAKSVTQTLGFGFCTANQPFVIGGGVNLLASDGPGNLRSVAGTTPGAGAEITETVPTSARWELLSLTALLTTSATVANRAPSITCDDGTTVYFRSGLVTPIPASLASQTTWGEGLGQYTSANNVRLVSGLPVGNRLSAGHRIRTATDNLQAGDQWSAVQYLVREWFDA